MPKLSDLQDKDGNVIYPRTITDGIYDKNGNTMTEVLTTVVKSSDDEAVTPIIKKKDADLFGGKEPKYYATRDNVIALERKDKSLNTRVDNVNNEVNVLAGRMNTFTKLSDASTSGDAELQDIRVKADGTTATTAGNAVREQITELKEDLTNSEVIDNINLNFTDGYVQGSNSTLYSGYSQGFQYANFTLKKGYSVRIKSEYVSPNDIHLLSIPLNNGKYQKINYIEVASNIFEHTALNDTNITISIKTSKPYKIDVYKKVNDSNIIKMLNNCSLVSIPDIIFSDGYIASSNSTTYNGFADGFQYGKITLKRNWTVRVNTPYVYPDINLFSVCRLNGTFSRISDYSNPSENIYEYTARHDMEIMLSIRTSKDYKVDIFRNIHENLQIINTEWNNGFYRSKDSVLFDGEAGGYVYSQPIAISKNEKIHVIGYCANEISVITELMDGKAYNLVEGIDNNVEKEYTYVSNHDSVIVVCASLKGCSIYTEKLNDTKIPNYSLMCNKIICIGDSLTKGAFYSDDSQSFKEINNNYPYYLSKLTNATVVNGGRSGYTTKEWYVNEINKYDYSECDTAIIFLGTNGGLTDTLETDVLPYNDYNNYNDTNTGYYCRLVEKIRESNPNINILLCTVFAGGEGSANRMNTNITIEKICKKYNLGIIDISNSYLATLSNPLHCVYQNSPNIHFTMVGNLELANFIYDGINTYISSHKLRYEVFAK